MIKGTLDIQPQPLFLPLSSLQGLATSETFLHIFVVPWPTPSNGGEKKKEKKRRKKKVNYGSLTFSRKTPVHWNKKAHVQQNVQVHSHYSRKEIQCCAHRRQLRGCSLQSVISTWDHAPKKASVSKSKVIRNKNCLTAAPNHTTTPV